MPVRPDASVARTIEVDGGTIHVRRQTHGVWAISLEFDKERYPKARAGSVEKTPPTIQADSLDAVISWARDEWALRKGPTTAR
jgi:hypothetical protein